LKHAFFGCNSPESGHVHATEALNIKRPTCPVGLVVELWINFCHLVSLMKIESLRNRVDIFLFSEVNVVSPHELNICNHEFARSTKSQVIILIVTLIGI